MSEKHDQEYFSDGLSEELIDHLAHNPDLKVIARTSSFAFKGKNEDMTLIAAKLGSRISWKAAYVSREESFGSRRS